MNFLIAWVGFSLIWIAADVGRKDDSKVKVFSWDFLLQFILISAGIAIITAVSQKPC
jgi:hypothetical protein